MNISIIFEVLAGGSIFTSLGLMMGITGIIGSPYNFESKKEAIIRYSSIAAFLFIGGFLLLLLGETLFANL